MLVGYSLYLREGGDRKKSPSVSKIMQYIIEHGGYQQPSPPGKVTSRKKKNEIKLYLEMYDDSLEVKRSHVQSPYLHVATSADSSIVLELGLAKDTSEVFAVDHPFDILCLPLNAKLRGVVQSLNKVFLMRYGSSGLRQCHSSISLKNTEGVDGLMWWSTGQYTNSVEGIFRQIGLQDLIMEALMHVCFMTSSVYREATASGIGLSNKQKADLKAKAFAESNELDVYQLTMFKLNRLREHINVQYPHLHVSKDEVKELHEIQGAQIMKVIVSLDKCGLLLRVWPNGVKGDTFLQSDRLIYLPPGEVLLLPLSCATSDCIRFSPLGQRRVELIICAIPKGEELPEGLTTGNDPHYLIRPAGANEDSSAANFATEGPYLSERLLYLLKMFDFYK